MILPTKEKSTRLEAKYIHLMFIVYKQNVYSIYIYVKLRVENIEQNVLEKKPSK